MVLVGLERVIQEGRGVGRGWHFLGVLIVDSIEIGYRTGSGERNIGLCRVLLDVTDPGLMAFRGLQMGEAGL